MAEYRTYSFSFTLVEFPVQSEGKNSGPKLEVMNPLHGREETRGKALSLLSLGFFLCKRDDIPPLLASLPEW